MTLHVREARRSDADVIVEFNCLLASETEDLALDRAVVSCGVSRVLGDPALGRYYVAEDGERILGQVMVTYEWSDWRDGLFWWIQSVYVLPEARRLGAFTALHDTVSAAAVRAGAIGLRLYVYQSNALAQQVYLRRGMHDAGYRVLEEVFGARQPHP
jgi:GNAT superfamily N-acetyltransferase